MKLTYDGAGTYRVFVSPDGQDFLQLASFPATSYFTTAGDQVGFGFNINDPSSTVAMLMLQWAGI